MTRERWIARYGRDAKPTDKVPRTGYNDFCPACRLGYPHQWRRHDAAIEKHQKPKQEAA